MGPHPYYGPEMAELRELAEKVFTALKTARLDDAYCRRVLAELDPHPARHRR